MTSDALPVVESATVLIVDDTLANLTVVVASLEQNDLRVVVAQDAEEGLERAERVRPDLILLDVMMPRMDGFEMCRRLKSRPATRDIPVIFMTSLAGTEGKLKAFEVGAVDYVTKPLQVEEVQARVGAHLKLRDMQKQMQARNQQLQQEIMERRLAEQRLEQRTAQLAESVEELEAFCYTVSHDLRAPLRAVLGFANLLTQEPESIPQPAREHLDRIVQAAQRMDVLIADLLLYARTGQRTVQTVPTPLEPIVRHLRSTFSQRLSSLEAQLRVVEPLATPIGDSSLIEQILTNLVDNALTYRQPAGVAEVRLSARLRGDRVELQVADNGIGIPAADHERVFQMFQRLHSYSEYPGTGIGLAIVAKAARLLRGEVRVESVPGEGSAFTVSLPAADT